MQRPISVTIMAILGLVFGIIGVLCCTPMSLIGLIAPQETTFELMGQVVESPPPPAGAAFVVILISQLIDFALSALLIAASVGALMLKPWGRVSFLWYGVAKILNNFLYIGGMLPTISWQMDVTRGMMDSQIPDGALLFSGIVGMVCSALCFSIYPIAALVVFTRQRVKEAFANGGTPPGGWQQTPQQGGYYPPQQPQQGYYPPPQDQQQGGYYPPQGQQEYYYPPQQQYPQQQYPPQEQQGGYYPPEDYEPPPEDEGPPGQDRR